MRYAAVALGMIASSKTPEACKKPGLGPTPSSAGKGASAAVKQKRRVQAMGHVGDGTVPTLRNVLARSRRQRAPLSRRPPGRVQLLSAEGSPEETR